MSGSEEARQLELLGGLKDQAIGEYEDLRAENKKTKEECDKIKQQRDEAVKQLEEIQKISHMVIEEVSCIQNHLEIEKTCRESAEALATKEFPKQHRKGRTPYQHLFCGGGIGEEPDATSERAYSPLILRDSPLRP